METNEIMAKSLKMKNEARTARSAANAAEESAAKKVVLVVIR